MKMRVIALNFLSSRGTHKENEVEGVNIYTDLCGNPNYEDSVYMSPAAYVNVFCKRRPKTCRHVQRLSVVKITNPENGESIYRKYVFNPFFKGIGDNDMALHPASIRELAGGGDNETVVGKHVCARKGCFFAYYWNHPFHATRISMKLGVVSIILACLSIIVTVYLSCYCC